MKLIDITAATPIPVGYRLAFLTIFYREPLLRRLERDFGLVRPAWTVLICLTFRDGLVARDICEITEQPSNTVSRGVAWLVARGHVRRVRDPGDGRRDRLFLAPSGRDLHDRAMALFVAAEAEMTAAERADLIRLLDKLCRDVPRWKAAALPPSPQEPRDA